MESSSIDLKLPDDCVIGGLRNLPGQWTFWDGDRWYPTFAGDCKKGFEQVNVEKGSNNHPYDFTRYTWSDGTRLFIRAYEYFRRERVNARAFCVMPDRSLAVAVARIDNWSRSHLTTRAQRLDAAPPEPAARGLSLISTSALALERDAPARIEVFGGNAYIFGSDQAGIELVDVTSPAFAEKSQPRWRGEPSVHLRGHGRGPASEA